MWMMATGQAPKSSSRTVHEYVCCVSIRSGTHRWRSRKSTWLTKSKVNTVDKVKSRLSKGARVILCGRFFSDLSPSILSLNMFNSVNFVEVCNFCCPNIARMSNVLSTLSPVCTGPYTARRQKNSTTTTPDSVKLSSKSFRHSVWPCCEAVNTGVIFISSKISARAPCSSNNAVTSCWPVLTATCSADILM